MKNTLSEKLAAVVAQKIAETGISWSKARQELIDDDMVLTNSDLPSDDQIETALREYYAIFDPIGHAQRLMELRKIAVHVMEMLDSFKPEITKGVLNGCADKFSDIHLQVICDTPKELEIFLLNQGFEPEVVAPQGTGQGQPAEEILFEAPLLQNSYFFDNKIPVWVKIKVFDHPGNFRRRSKKTADNWQIEEEAVKSANLEELINIIKIIESRK